MKVSAWLKLKMPLLAGATAAYAVGISMRELTRLWRLLNSIGDAS